MEQLEEQLSYKFRNPELLQQALTHNTLPTPTNSPFNTKKQTCDHLKVLGDCVIKLMTSQYAICVALPNEKVHKIVKCKDNLSNRYCQNLIGKTLGLDEKGIVVTNLPYDQIPSHLDTFVKSLFGAIFLDAGGSEKKGYFSCWKVFLKLWKSLLISYGTLKPLVACFPEPKYSSQEFLKERFNNYKIVDLKLLEEKIGFQFYKHPHILEQAMTHDTIEMFRSSGNHDPTCPEFAHFQTLEFLGDAVLELVIMEYLYLRSTSADPLGQILFFNRDTGQKLYSSRFQIQVANKLKLGEFVIKPPQIGLVKYDDFVESLIGSIFVHAKAIGLRACAKVVLEMWGLEPSLEEEEHEATKEEEMKQKVPENSITNKKVVKQSPETTVGVSTPPLSGPTVSPSTSTTATASSIPTKEAAKPTKPSKKEAANYNELQAKMGYKFVKPKLLLYLPPKIDASTPESKVTSTNLVNTCKNLQVIGKRALDLVIAEYVIKICHSSSTADLSAEMKKSVTKLMQYLASDDILHDICSRFHLAKYFTDFKLEFLEESKMLRNPTTSSSDIIHLIFGAVFVDSSGDIDNTIQKLFLRFWQNYVKSTKPEVSLRACFPDTSEKQQKFRAAVNAQITNPMWLKMFVLIGHTFTHKNLLEQALTDEKSQGYAKQHVDAYPLGNPFGLQILGKCVIDLFSARRCYLNTISEPGNFEGVLQRFDQSLFNTLKSRFHNLEFYYGNHFKYPFPPKKNPRAPYETMLAALYLDVGGGVKGMQKIHKAVEKACPTLLDLKKPKPVKQASPENETTIEVKSTTVLVEAGSKSGDQQETKEPIFIPSLPSNCTKVVQEELNISFGSPECRDSVSDDRLMSEFHINLGYKFVDPLLLKLVLDVNVPSDDDDNVQMSSKNHFEVFKILGKRAFSLLATEFALESVQITNNSDLSSIQKQQVEVHRRHLTTPVVLDMIANTVQLAKYAASPATPSERPASQEDIVLALFGAIYVDSRANYLKIFATFNKLLKVRNVNPMPTHPQLAKCFPMTAEGQVKLRTVTNTAVSDSKWKKIYTKLGYKFKNRNLLEQALTDESSQEAAKIQHNAYPTGSPFALRLLGKCVIELAIAYKTIPISLNTPVVAYQAAVEQIEKSLFNSFINNFLGIEKYYACINIRKNQKFPPTHLPFGPYEAMMGAVFVDSGMGNPGIDTITTVIVHRNVGLKNVIKPNIDVLDVIPISPVVKLASSNPPSPVKVAAATKSASPAELTAKVLRCVTPVPSTSSESLNTSFNSKCAANFGFSPVQFKASPPKPVTMSQPQHVVKEPIVTSTAPVQQQPNSKPSALNSPKNQPPQNTYASAVVNGQPAQADNKLVIAVTKAQSQIHALRKKQETIDHYRKISIEKEKLLHQDQDQMSNASSSSTRSRCPSSSTLNSKGSQKQVPGQKRKRGGGKGNKNQNKKAKAAAVQQPEKHVPPTELKQEVSPRVSAWCQNQLDRMSSTEGAALSSSSSSSLVGVASSCTEVHQQRSTFHPLQQNKPKVLDDETSSQSSSPTTHSTPVPVNMVSGYRKSVVGDDTSTSTNTKISKSTHPMPSDRDGECSISAIENADDSSAPPSNDGFSYLRVLKWTSLILGVAFLLKKYSQGK